MNKNNNKQTNIRKTTTDLKKILLTIRLTYFYCNEMKSKCKTKKNK